MRPMVDVFLSIGEIATPRTPAMIDTGCPITVFPRGIGDLLQVNPDEFLTDPPEKIKLLGMDWAVFSVPVNIELPPFSDLVWSADVRFVVDEGLPIGLLGYEGFLNRWVVSINGYAGYSVVETIESFQERLPIDAEAEFYKIWPDIY